MILIKEIAIDAFNNWEEYWGKISGNMLPLINIFSQGDSEIQEGILEWRA